MALGVQSDTDAVGGQLSQLFSAHQVEHLRIGDVAVRRVQQPAQRLADRVALLLGAAALAIVDAFPHCFFRLVGISQVNHAVLRPAYVFQHQLGRDRTVKHVLHDQPENRRAVFNVVGGDVHGGGAAVFPQQRQRQAMGRVESIVDSDDYRIIGQRALVQLFDGLIKRGDPHAEAPDGGQPLLELGRLDEQFGAEAALVRHFETVIAQNLQLAARKPARDAEQSQCLADQKKTQLDLTHLLPPQSPCPHSTIYVRCRIGFPKNRIPGTRSPWTRLRVATVHCWPAR